MMNGTSLGLEKTRGVAFRLAGGYVVLICMILLVAGLGIGNIGKIRASYDQVLDVRIPRITELQRIQALLSGLNVSARDALLTSNPESLGQVFASIESGRVQVGEQLAQLQKALQDEGSKESLEVADQVANDASGVLIGLVKFSRYVKADKREQAQGVLEASIRPQLQQLSQHIGSYQESQISSLSEVKSGGARMEASVTRDVVLLAAASLLIACAFAFWVVRSVVAPLRDATEMATHMARGDFSRSLQARREDEVGQVVHAFNQISSGLTELVCNIRGSASQVHEVAQDIGERNLRLENRVGEQTQSLHEVMAFIAGVQKVIEQNERVAGEAAGVASQMESIAAISSQSVTAAVHEMEAVQQASHRITDIIALIDAIAFQTNILALNAAVEAARAGAQGRGFAVVASEVRGLAGRCAEASKEIRGLVFNSQTRVSCGTEKVQSIASNMSDVSSTVGDLKRLVEDMSGGSQVQSMKMRDMIASVAQLQAGNDSNAQLVSGLGGALEELRHMAQSLTGQVAAFKTHGVPPAGRA